MPSATNEFLLYGRPLFGAVAFLLGATIGSFINVISLRLPKMMEKDWRSQCCELLGLEQQAADNEPSFNLAFPASHCFNCQHKIRWWENIPVISYIALKGKCSNCQQAISIQYPLVEILTAVFSAAVVAQMGISVQACAALLLTWCLITLATIDLRTTLLPDDITLPLIWAGLAVNMFTVFVTLEDAVIGAITGYLVLWIVFWLYKLFTQKEGMGYGDFKLLAALGAWIGWQSLPLIILLSSLVGTLVGVTLILLKIKDSQATIPFGPYLAAAGWIAMMWGNNILHQFDAFYLF